MERQKTILKKLIVMAMIFMILFSNCGFTIQAIATSDEFEVVKKGFFQKNEMNYKVYFEDENGKEVKDIIADVNDKLNLVVEVEPNVIGYLQSGTLRATPLDSDNLNFKFVSVKDDLSSHRSQIAIPTKDEEVINEEVTPEVEPEVEEPQKEETIENTVVEDTISNEIENVTVENVVENSTESSNVVSNETVVDNAITNTVENVVSNTIVENTTVENTNSSDVEKVGALRREFLTEGTINTGIEFDAKMNESVAEQQNNNDEIPVEEFVDEEAIIEEKLQEAEKVTYLYLDNDIELVSENEVSLTNIVNKTKIEIEVVFNKEEVLNLDSLLSSFVLQFSGTFINQDLEEVRVGMEKVLSVGWNYTNDIELESTYTKFSPFVVGETKGTLVENSIVVKREITDENYLPLKETIIEVKVPEMNGQKPISIDVSANRLMATLGLDAGYVDFSHSNWSYDENSEIISIRVVNENNNKAIYTQGLDEYVILYRFNDYIDENSNLEKNVKVTAIEYSVPNNNTLIKEINTNEDIKVDIGELITYSINTNEDLISKAKVNANYNQETPVYEALFTNQVSVKLLTSDLVRQFKIDSTKDYYIDNQGSEFEAKNIIYKSIEFNHSELQAILDNGGEIVVTDIEGNQLVIINKEVLDTRMDVTYNLNNVEGILLYVNNVASNGNLNYEVTKAITKCNYEKSAFMNFKSIESRISAEVKYSEFEEVFKLPTIGCKKDFSKSSTKANLYVNRDTLSSTKSNDNVELKIELNDDEETSDLYINPMFEIVFPKYVREVSVQSINVLFDNGLKVKDFETYTESDVVKMRVELEGTQTTFNSSVISNGTNIIISTNIKVDELAPAKEDQYRLYYANEGVTNYESQTKWTVSKSIPNGILKDTNGFDAVVMKYQTPSGFVTVNSIKNYDGDLGKVTSIREGKVTGDIPINSDSRIATMELMAFNNTENTCSNVMLIGRIPFKGNTDVITGNDLETNVNTVLTSLINSDPVNANIVEIYYSTNEKATASFDATSNWTQTPEDVSKVKSFLIVVKGLFKAGEVLRFTYDFNIPENLPYETEIQGSFGGYYVEERMTSKVKDSSVADVVGLKTESGPKLEARLDVSVGDGNQIGTARKLDYTITVTNPGSVIARDVNVKVPIPEFTSYYTKDDTSPYGNYGYFEHIETEEFFTTLGTINPNSTKTTTFSVFTSRNLSLEDYADGQDEKGYYKNKIVGTEEVIEKVPMQVECFKNHNHDEEDFEEITVIKDIYEKEYVTEVPALYIECTGEVETSMTAKSIKTNTVKNELVNSNFKSAIKLDFEGDLLYGDNKNFRCLFENISGGDINDVKVSFNLGKIYTFKYAKLDGEDIEGTVNEEEGKVYFDIGDMVNQQLNEIIVNVDTKLISTVEETNDSKFEFYGNNKVEESLTIPQKILRDMLKAEDISYQIPSAINEEDSFTISTKITNIGTHHSQGASFIGSVDKSKVSIQSVKVNGNKNLSVSSDAANEFGGTLPTILPGESVTIDVVVKSLNTEGSEDSTIELNRKIVNKNQEDINLDPVKVNIKNNIKTSEEIEKEKYNEYLALEKENQANQQSLNVNVNNNQNPGNNGTPSNSQTQAYASSNQSNNGNNPTTQTNASNSQKKDFATTTNANNSNNVTNNTSNKGSNNQENQNNQAEEKRYRITGKVWLDNNRNGIREDDDKGINKEINAYLLDKNNSMIQSATTSNDGSYKFENVREGTYFVAFFYNNEKYGVTTYKNVDAGDEKDCDAIESVSEYANAVTNEIILNQDVANIDLGLYQKDSIDVKIDKYISSIVVATNKGEKTYNFEDESLAKVEIRSKELKGAQVKFNYKIVVENIGDLKANIEAILDFVPEGMSFDQSANINWFVTEDGLLCLRDSELNVMESGVKKEFNLTLIKEMNEENTGTVLNKVGLINVHSDDGLLDENDNNINVQNVIVLVSTGRTQQILVFIITILLISFIVYQNKNRLLFIKNKPSRKKIKAKLKKVYK